MASKRSEESPRFQWYTDKLAGYSPTDWPGLSESISKAFMSLSSKRYHDEHDIYEPFERVFAKLFGYKKSTSRVSADLQYLRNRVPKAFRTQEAPDFTFSKRENVIVEIKNREPLDKRKSRELSPHEQVISQLDSM